MKTNKTLLQDWIKKQKKTNPQIEIDVIKAVRISISSWKKILYVEGWLPNAQTRLLLAQYTGLNENELFHQIEDQAA